ncbi:MAG: hypothetical protein COB20_16395 [SAR86 cluster bacterium]|uniref:HTH araC/xylS-type domain-containing protein n=1 Tax=SAR86 cluster bacterium TaxID=2030880 RepID=A0A2A4WS75_9GAMM|nr:MAG: hypothetical protein COB20_16395 [SAR86 cluster bacterium]
MLDRYLKNLSVEVEPFAICMLDMGWRLTLPGPPVAMLHFIVQGEGWVISTDGQRQRIGPNWLVVIPAGNAHSLETRGQMLHELRIESAPEGPPVHRISAGNGGPLEIVTGCGTVNVRYGEAVGLFDHLSQTLAVDLSSIPGIPLLYQSILSEQEDGQPGEAILQGAIMMQLLVHMFRKLSSDSEFTLPWLAALDDPRLAATLDAIIENPCTQHTVESLAEIAHMSRSAFAKSFHEAFDRSPINLLNHVRMEQAARLLGTGQVPVEQVASHIGYSSRSHFSQAFKKHTGMTPIEYRRS